MWMPWLEAALFVIPLALSLVVQAYARARVASWLGDDTPAREGRLTLAPSAHVDAVGTFAVPMALVVLQGAGGFLPLLGWARPVAVSVSRMRRSLSARTLEMLVALASPAASFLLALASALALLAFAAAPANLRDAGIALSLQLLTTNVALAVFQMLPVGPLAGFFVLVGMVPRRLAPAIEAFNAAWGQWLLLAVVFFGRGLLVGPCRLIASALLRMVGAA